MSRTTSQSHEPTASIIAVMSVLLLITGVGAAMFSCQVHQPPRAPVHTLHSPPGEIRLGAADRWGAMLETSRPTAPAAAPEVAIDATTIQQLSQGPCADLPECAGDTYIVDGIERVAVALTHPCTPAGHAWTVAALELFDSGRAHERVNPLVPGDTDGDGVVGAADLLRVLEHWSEGSPPR